MILLRYALQWDNLLWKGGLENKYIKNKWHFKILETVFD